MVISEVAQFLKYVFLMSFSTGLRFRNSDLNQLDNCQKQNHFTNFAINSVGCCKVKFNQKFYQRSQT